MLNLLCLLALVSSSLASYATNLNYRSPSLHHPGLGISIRRVVKRHNPLQRRQSIQYSFTHNVASGDPYPNSVILWTRCAPSSDNVASNSTVQGYVPLYNPVPIYNDTDEGKPPSTAPVCLTYKVATDENLADIVDQGQVYTSSDVDYTVKVEATGLEPFSTYYYQFAICDSKVTSPTGRTKTTPAPNDAVSSVGLAVFSCSNYPFGFFNAYGNAARKGAVDYMIHLGDYIYEYKNGDYGHGQTINRVPLPDRTIFTLYDYRKRLATYRTDADLALNHQHYPWITVWDDHEVADNTYRDGSSELNNTEASFVQDGGVSVDQRKMNAVRAYFEWMPLRQVEMDDNLRIWRSFSIGSLVDLIMLDTRQYDRSITDLYWNTDYVHSISNDAGRSMMGTRQENWFYRTLKESKARNATWRVIGSQTVFSRINESVAYGNVNPLDYDAWDGYQANRNRTLQTLYDNDIGNNIVISGDSHANWVSDLTWLSHTSYNSTTGSASLGAEFAGTAVTSPSPYGQNISLATSNLASTSLISSNPELQWSELYYRGYFELHISPEKTQARYFGMPTVVGRNGGEISLANFTIKEGGNRLERFNVAGDGEGLTVAEGGIVEHGVVRGGVTMGTNLTNETSTGVWSVTHFDQEDL